MLRTIFLSGLILILSCLLSLKTNSQTESIETQSKKPSFVRKVVKQTGWKIPTDKSFKYITKEKGVIEGISIEYNYGVFEKKFLYYLEYYYLGEDMTLYPNEFPCAPRTLTSIKPVNSNKIIGYIFSCSLVKLNQKGEYLDYYSADTTCYFWDEDGDRIFETFYFSSKLPKIPAWAKE